MDDDRKALEELILNNPDLDRLESLLAQFNIFEVLGAVRQELRHSDFLAYLMRPQETHGLGEEFLRRFLQTAVAGMDFEALPFTAIDLDIWDLSDVDVRREWHGMDILLASESLKLAVVIENKVDSSEHSNQLDRYYKIMVREFPGWQHLGIFLTPDGEEASDERYLPVSYLQVCELLEDIIAHRGTVMGPDVLILMTHYTQMLRRHIVSGSEIEVLCQRIYKKHQKALDLIYEYRSDLRSEIYDLILERIEENDDLVQETSSKSFIRFLPKAWLNSSILTQGAKYKHHMIPLFVVENFPDVLRIRLKIIEGNDAVRGRLFSAIMQTQDKFFKISQRILGKTEQQVYAYNILTRKDIESAQSIEDVGAKIGKKWERFIFDDLPRLLDFMQNQSWLWSDLPE
jgi:hypothetical protein